ncbi:MAG: PIN domain-containing protein [Methanotrichaceae archaeon]|nr:PIN domain-containing protein [Methanotrichaceae archaeon]
MKVVLDTNCLMVPMQFNVDIFSELLRLGYTEYLVPFAVIKELENLAAKSSGRNKSAARMGVALSQKCKVVELSCEAEHAKDADIIIENLAAREGAAVFTNDRALKKRLSSKGITVIYLRQGRYLETTKRDL